MTGVSICVFETPPLGWSALAWGEGGIVAARLPESDVEGLTRHMKARFPEAHQAAPPPHISRAIEDLVALFAGEKRDLLDAPLDMETLGDFERRVYDIARSIPPGETLTYGDIARRLGDLSLSRAVGQALGRNPFPPIVPCHRVLGAGGKTGGFSARGGVDTKLRLLNIEQAHLKSGLFDDLPLAAKPRDKRS
jgi:methylated-DNA-[protein]-cysteine S-methyltransferase